MPLSETRVIKYFSPFQQPDVNRIETIISTSLTKKHHWTKLALLRSPHNVPSRFSAYRQKKKLELSCSFATLPVLNISTRNPGRTSVALVSLECIFKAGIRSQSDHESEAKGGTFTQLPASSSSKCTAGTSLTSSQMAKRKPWGIKALFVVLCLEQLRIPCNGKGDHGELQMFPAAPLCSSTGSPCWQLFHRGLDGSKAVRSQRSRAGVCHRRRKQSHSYKVAVKSPTTRLHQQLGTVSQITTHFFT